MKIGYPCINRTIGCTSNRTFRLVSYNKKRLIETIKLNLDCLEKILEFNLKNNLLFFRIGSPLIPFASHPICKFKWQNKFKNQFKKIGIYLRKNKFRISMHPDQFVVINALKKEIIEKSIKEIKYHCDVLDLLGLNESAKVQIHLGGVYDDKKLSIERFINVYNKLSRKIKKRLVIENDHLNYSLKDCLYVSKKTDIPVVFDFFHHECFNNGEDYLTALTQAAKTWKKKDGVLMTDYSLQKRGARKGSHAEKINIKKFNKIIQNVSNIDFDLMLEIKDKEKSALKVRKFLNIKNA